MKKTALLFPGQGSQEKNMGRDLAESDSDILDIWKKAERASNIALREIYWDGDEAAMADTRNLQPALTAANLSIWHAASKMLSPACSAGHSLGEFSAIAASGALSLDDTFEIVALRGRLMAEADPEGKGAMSAIVKLKLETVRELVEATVKETGELLIVAHHNTPGPFVISGTKAACAHCGELVKGIKGRAIPLAVSGAFHSPLMEEASRELAGALGKLSWNNPLFPVYCNALGTAVNDAETLKSVMQKQMTSSVLWIDTIKNQWTDGVRRWVELGPKAVLSKMVKPILEAIPGALAQSEAPDTLVISHLNEIEALR